MRVFLWFLAAFVAGAAAFWLPDIAVHALRGQSFSVDPFILTALLPLIAVLAFRGLLLRSRRSEQPPNPLLLALGMVLGIWILGPLAMSVNGMFSGGGSQGQGVMHDTLLMIRMFPLTTVMGSAYDGTLFAVFLVSAALPAFALAWMSSPEAVSTRLAGRILWAAVLVFAGIEVVLVPSSDRSLATSDTANRQLTQVMAEDVSFPLKFAYYGPKAPPYLAGAPAVIPISRLKDAPLPNLDTEHRAQLLMAPVLYVNLPSATWAALRRQGEREEPIYPLAWSREPDAEGQRVVLMVNLATDEFAQHTEPDTSLQVRLTQMQDRIGDATGKPAPTVNVNCPSSGSTTERRLGRAYGGRPLLRLASSATTYPPSAGRADRSGRPVE